VLAEYSVGARLARMGNIMKNKKIHNQHLLEKMPVPECAMGYTRAQVEQMFGLFMHNFDEWMSGQTTVLCTGKEYDHAKNQYVAARCAGCAEKPGGHGGVYYIDDVHRFILGLPIID